MNPAGKRLTAHKWRPSWRDVLGSPVHLVAFGGGAGLAPRAPGTAGTLVGIPAWYLMSSLSVPAYLGVLVVASLFGCWICGASARRLGVHDYGGIVFDEIVGFLITCLPIVIGLGRGVIPEPVSLLFAFVLFRLFDIWKPWPIDRIDKHVHGGVGIMLDDLLAGVYAALALAFLICLTVEEGIW